jgi:coenzyme F420-0:L-glutamate ligase/coenzyme F420-1:gamma-L-glutamate ligase
MMTGEVDFWEVLEERRSIRKFTSEPVPEDFVDLILRAGVGAPNARHRQSWRFVVLNSSDKIDRLADTLNENFIKDMLAAGKPAEEVDQKAAERKARICGAPVVVVMFVDVSDLSGFDSSEPNNKEYLMAVQSVALAGGQMLLAAQALGLGGLWMGGPLHAQQKLISSLNLPETWLAQGLLLFGNPGEHPEKKARKPMDEVVRYF